MLCIAAGCVECKKSHQKAAHRKTIPFDAGFYAVWQKSQLVARLPLSPLWEDPQGEKENAVPPALYNSGRRK